MIEIKIVILVNDAFEFRANDAKFKIGRQKCSDTRACTTKNKLIFTCDAIKSPHHISLELLEIAQHLL